ncbi:MAG: hypothetical protein M0018_02480, partial [Nitrospiraceae bacterium]|nr:hypothetical protein [Nitrospiraceae bacterium]
KNSYLGIGTNFLKQKAKILKNQALRAEKVTKQMEQMEQKFAANRLKSKESPEKAGTYKKKREPATSSCLHGGWPPCRCAPAPLSRWAIIQPEI